MSSERDRQLQTARDIDRMSTAMLKFGAKVVKRNPMKVGSYLVGILICLFFSGFKVSENNWNTYKTHVDKIDYDTIDEAETNMKIRYDTYYRSKGKNNMQLIYQ